MRFGSGLGTDGVGVNGDFGFLYRPHERFQLGVTYRTESVVHSQGQASGNASAQLQSLGGDFLNVPPDFRYDAEVVNHFPQMVMAGLSWKIHSRVRLALEVDWINWSAAFDHLQIKLKHGNNEVLNSFVGSTAAEDFVPLLWQDRFVYRGGLEFRVAENFFLRTGYSYGKSPVPDGTLTPLTGVISEQTFAAGAGYRRGRYQVDLGYQYNLPMRRQTHLSDLKAGEYSNSQVELDIHWVALSTSIWF